MNAGRPARIGSWIVLAAIVLLTRLFLADSQSRRRNNVDRVRTEQWLNRHMEREAGNAAGRCADSPTEIPSRGWLSVLFRVYNNVSEHRILALAAGMTYYTLLAIFPGLGALVAIYGLFSDPGTIASYLDHLSGILPGGAIDVLNDQLRRVSSKGGSTLGLTFLIGFVISLWSANAAMKSLFDTLNVVYAENEWRSFITLNAISLVFTIGAIMFALVAIVGIVILPVALNYIGSSHSVDWLLRLGRWPAMLIAVAFGLALVYRFGPSRKAPRWRWITWGSTIASVLWLLASVVFSFYAANFGSFNATYGSLGAAIGFMTWLWLSAIVVLLGAELDAELERQTGRDPAR